MLEMEVLQGEMINRSYPLSHNNTIMNLLIFLDPSSNYIIADNYDSSSNDHVNNYYLVPMQISMLATTNECCCCYTLHG